MRVFVCVLATAAALLIGSSIRALLLISAPYCSSRSGVEKPESQLAGIRGRRGLKAKTWIARLQLLTRTTGSRDREGKGLCRCAFSPHMYI